MGQLNISSINTATINLPKKDRNTPLSKDYPNRMILEHISLHDDEIKIYENRTEEGMWVEIERHELGTWSSPTNPNKLHSPANDIDNGNNIGWVCVFHGVKDGWW